MGAEQRVAEHYGRAGLEQVILGALAKAGKDPERLTAADLSAVDEFHVGGVESTRELAPRMDLQPGMRVLDVGCGIGGPARFFASEHGCLVSGIDLTEEFVNVAKALTRTVKLDDKAQFRQGNALQLPYEAASFDRAYTIHVLMNIADKAAVFREVRRVLKPNGLFAIFDIMRGNEGALQYPVPWAESEETSFVSSAKEYRTALEGAGFRVEQERDRSTFGVEFTERMMARVAQSGPPVLGLHLLMGDKTPVLLKNVLAMMKSGVLTAVELYARAV